MKKKKKRQNFVDILLKILGRFFDFVIFWDIFGHFFLQNLIFSSYWAIGEISQKMQKMWIKTFRHFGLKSNQVWQKKLENNFYGKAIG